MKVDLRKRRIQFRSYNKWGLLHIGCVFRDGSFWIFFTPLLLDTKGIGFRCISLATPPRRTRLHVPDVFDGESSCILDWLDKRKLDTFGT